MLKLTERALPLAVDRPAFDSASRSATLSIIGLSAIAFWLLLAGASYLDVIHLVGLKAAGRPMPSDEAFIVVAFVRMMPRVLIALHAFTAVAFTVWIGAANRNAAALGNDNLEYDVRDARLSFYIPFLNLTRPYGVMSEIWQASDPRIPSDDPMAWPGMARSPLIGWWWGLYIGGGILSWVSLAISKNSAPSDPGFALGFAAFDVGVEAVAAILATALVIFVQQRQRQLHLRRSADTKSAGAASGSSIEPE